MDYGDTLRVAFKLWWEKKYLWLFGILVALFSNTVDFDFGGNSESGYGESRVSTFSEQGMESLKDQFLAFVSGTDYLMLSVYIVIGVLVTLIFAAGAIYVGGKARTVLILVGMKHYKKEMEALKLSQAWGMSGNYWVELLIMNLIIMLGYFLLGVIVAIPVILVFIVTGLSFRPEILFILIPLACVLIPVLFVSVIVTELVKELASREIVLNAKKALEALKLSFVNFKQNWAEIVVAYLLSILPSAAFGIIIMIVMMPLGMLAVGGNYFLAVFSENDLPSIIYSVFMGILIWLVSSLVVGPMETFMAHYWNIVYAKLDLAKYPKETEKVEIV